MNINFFDSAILVSAISGGIVGGLVAVILTLGLLRGDRKRRVEPAPATENAKPVAAAPASSAPPLGAARAETRFERFDAGAKRVLAVAREEATRMSHNWIGTEHLLLGLVRETEGIAGRVLASQGVDLAKVRTAVEFILGKTEAAAAGAEMTVTPRSHKVVDLAIEEAHRLGRPLVGGEHLLLGLLDEGEGIAIGVLESLGVSPERLRAKVVNEIGGAPAGYAPPTQPTAKTRTSPFNRFTDRGKRVLALAQDEAMRLGHPHIGTEHLVLGLARMTEMPVPDQHLRKMFGDLHLVPEQLRVAVASAVPPRELAPTPPQLTITPRAKRVLELAVDDAVRNQRPTVEAEDVLLSLVRVPESVGAKVLMQAGATEERVRAALAA